MTNNNRGDDSWIFVVVGGCTAIAAFVVWKFAVLFDLDMSTAGAVVFRLVLLAVVVGCVWWWFGDTYDAIGIGTILLIVTALIWACWWPALDYWASQVVPTTNLFDYSQSPSALGMETPWWAAWYTKWGGFLAIICLGYLARRKD